MLKGKKEVAILASGCFWCTEGVFKRVKGYIGGKSDSTTYKEVCSGKTGHAECVKIEYDPDQVSFVDILTFFFASHDPTTLNSILLSIPVEQGNDVGTQYRSGIFFLNEEQKKTAENMIASLKQQKAFDKQIVTEVTKATKFIPAEEYHQDYVKQNPSNGYCRMVVKPKLKKFEKFYLDYMKKQSE